MPLRAARPLSWHPKGCSDAADGTNAFPGAMLQLANLVPSSSTNEEFVPRPAAIGITNLSNLDAPGFQSGHLVIGDIEYGMIATSRNPGQDEPYAYNLATSTYLPVAGITAANTPASPPPTGDWTPPILAQVGTRVIVTHPGFPDGPFTAPFFDQPRANTYTGTDIIDGWLPAAGIYTPGMMISGLGIPDNTIINSIAPLNISTTCSGTDGETTITVASATGIVIGMMVDLPIFAPPAWFATVVAISGTTITMDRVLEFTISGAAALFAGAALTVSHNSTSSTTFGEAVTISQPGTLGTKFGWFDVSGLSITLPATVNQNSPIVALATDLGLQPGLTVSGTGIPPGTTIAQIDNPTIAAFDGITLNASSFMAAVISFVAGTPAPIPVIGQVLVGPNVPTGTTVGSVVLVSSSPGVVTYTIGMSQPATADGIGLYSLSGVFTVSLSALATSSGVFDLTFAGGTPAAPLWSAGDCSINPLPSIPVGVTQFNGRAYFACGKDGLPFSDSLVPCVRTNANQALIPADGLPIAAVGGLPLQAPITGGIIQAVIAFAGNGARMYQITGDPTTSNLSLQAMNVATGTNAPLSITPTNFGLVFMSSDGMRVVDFSGNVSDPIGDHGSGIAAPFINAVHPSRIAAASTADAIRISVLTQNQAQLMAGLAPRQQEWWFDITRKIWTGPHTFPVSLIQPWRNTFVVTPAPGTPIVGSFKLFRSDAEINSATTFVENGAVLTWAYQPVLLPDNGAMFMNYMNEAMLTASVPGGERVDVYAVDEAGELLDHVIINGVSLAPATWGTSIWNEFLWNFAGGAFLRQWPLNWTKGIVFKQMTILATGRSIPGYVLGNLNLRYQRTGYMMQPVPASAAS